MEQHPVPRQITTFEFKLVGFMTLRQFLYLLVFFPIAYIVMSTFPIPYLNIFLAAIIVFFGIALAFIPINDRPMDVYIKNFMKRVFSPTQYYYQKTNSFATTVQTYSDKQKKDELTKHKESKQILLKYLSQKKKDDINNKQQELKRKQEIEKELKTPLTNNLNISNKIAQHEASIKIDVLSNQQTQTSGKHPFLTGVVKNKRDILLPGMLVYIKDQNNNTLRLLKTNHLGTFSSFNPLPEGIYDIEIKDPNERHIFDTIKIDLKEENLKPFEFFSKELI